MDVGKEGKREPFRSLITVLVLCCEGSRDDNGSFRKENSCQGEIGKFRNVFDCLDLWSLHINHLSLNTPKSVS